MRESQVTVFVLAHDDFVAAAQTVELAVEQVDVDVEVCVVGREGHTATIDRLRTRFRSTPNVSISPDLADGAGSASNVALSTITTEFACHLPTNVHVGPDALAMLIEPLLSDSALVMSHGSVQVVDANGDYLARPYLIARYGRYIVQGGAIAHPLRLFRVAAWRQTAGYDSGLRFDADYDMFLKLGEVGGANYDHRQLSKSQAPLNVFESHIQRGPGYGDHMRAVRSGLVRRGGPLACKQGTSGSQIGTDSARIIVRFPGDASDGILALQATCPQWHFTAVSSGSNKGELHSSVLSRARAHKWAELLANSLAPFGAVVESTP